MSDLLSPEGLPDSAESFAYPIFQALLEHHPEMFGRVEKKIFRIKENEKFSIVVHFSCVAIFAAFFLCLGDKESFIHKSENADLRKSLFCMAKNSNYIFNFSIKILETYLENSSPIRNLVSDPANDVSNKDIVSTITNDELQKKVKKDPNSSLGKTKKKTTVEQDSSNLFEENITNDSAEKVKEDPNFSLEKTKEKTTVEQGSLADRKNFSIPKKKGIKNVLSPTTFTISSDESVQIDLEHKMGDLICIRWSGFDLAVFYISTKNYDTENTNESNGSNDLFNIINRLRQKISIFFKWPSEVPCPSKTHEIFESLVEYVIYSTNKWTTKKRTPDDLASMPSYYNTNNDLTASIVSKIYGRIINLSLLLQEISFLQSSFYHQVSRRRDPTVKNTSDREDYKLFLAQKKWFVIIRHKLSRDILVTNFSQLSMYDKNSNLYTEWLDPLVKQHTQVGEKIIKQIDSYLLHGNSQISSILERNTRWNYYLTAAGYSFVIFYLSTESYDTFIKLSSWIFLSKYELPFGILAVFVYVARKFYEIRPGGDGPDIGEDAAA